MTREEAISTIQDIVLLENLGEHYNKALHMAIEALSAEPSKVDFRTDKSVNIGTEVNDLISRAELTKHFKTFDEKYLTLDTICDEVQSAPSASLPQGDLISRTELLEKMLKEAQRYANDDIRHGYHNCECLVYDAPSVSAHRPTVDKCDGCLYEDSDKSLFPCNYCKRNYFDKYEKDESNYITESPNDVVEKNDEVIERPIIEHDREWIIGCIKHDGFIKTDRFDKANQIILDALADRPSGEWLEIEDYNGDYHYQCSACKDEFYIEYGTPKENGYTYCPSCGARMKGGGDD